MRWSSWKEEHLIDVRKSANIGHLWDENHLIGVHLTEMGVPEEKEQEEEKEEEEEVEKKNKDKEDKV